MAFIARTQNLDPSQWALVGALITLVVMARRSGGVALTGGFMLILAPFLINFVIGQALAHQVATWLAGLGITLTLAIRGRL